MVVYLNEAWEACDGGALVIWPENAAQDAAPAIVIVPKGGGVALMLSETIPHAVEPTLRPRYAIAAWWRVNPSIEGLVVPLD